MAFNPLTEKGMPLEKQSRSWSELNVKPYDSKSVAPYTRCRAITLNGAEIESVLFGHQMARHTVDPDVKRQLAQVRRIEQEQQKMVNWLIPGEETTLEVTIGYEQVAVDLTAWVAQQEPDDYARQAYEFGLLEDFDHLYRYANLMDLVSPRKAAELVGGLTEIMPGRPTFKEHRHPFDDVRKHLEKNAQPLSKLHAMTITAAEQQTMNFYMNVGNRQIEPIARGLYLEIAQVEEEHVTHYESLLDPTQTWAERLVWHEYNECYLYYSFMQEEEDSRIRTIWSDHLSMEIEHLRLACEHMKKAEKRDPAEFLPSEIPEPVHFQSNKDFIRKVLADQVWLTAKETQFVPTDSLPQDYRYFSHQRAVNGNEVPPSESIIDKHRAETGGEYRLETQGEHPVPAFRLPHAAE